MKAKILKSDGYTHWYKDSIGQIVDIFELDNSNFFYWNADINYPIRRENVDIIGETHYKKSKIEPIEYILANDLSFCEGNIVEYITRYKHKDGKKDLLKIKDYVDFLIKEHYSDAK